MFLSSSCRELQVSRSGRGFLEELAPMFLMPWPSIPQAKLRSGEDSRAPWISAMARESATEGWTDSSFNTAAQGRWLKFGPLGDPPMTPHEASVLTVRATRG